MGKLPILLQVQSTFDDLGIDYPGCHPPVSFLQPFFWLSPLSLSITVRWERGPAGFSCYTFLSCNFKFGGRGDLITYSRVGYMKKKTINYGNLTPVLNWLSSSPFWKSDPVANPSYNLSVNSMSDQSILWYSLKYLDTWIKNIEPPSHCLSHIIASCTVKAGMYMIT